LPRRYPDLRVYAVEAEWVDDRRGEAVDRGSGSRVVVQPQRKRREAIQGEVRLPVFAGMLQRDAYFYGFALTEEDARGNTDPTKQDPGWFFVLEEQPKAARFGLDVPQERFRGKAPKNWSALSWSHLVAEETPLPGFVDTGGPTWLRDAGALSGNGGIDEWGMDAAAMARITWQRPVRMLVHADAMLPDVRLPRAGPGAD